MKRHQPPSSGSSRVWVEFLKYLSHIPQNSRPLGSTFGDFWQQCTHWESVHSALPACGIWNSALCDAQPQTPTYNWSSQLLSGGNHMLDSNVSVIFYFASTNYKFEKPLIKKLPDLTKSYILRKSSLIWTNKMLSNSCLFPKCPAGTLAVTSTGSDFCAFLYEFFLSFKQTCR